MRSSARVAHRPGAGRQWAARDRQAIDDPPAQGECVRVHEPVTGLGGMPLGADDGAVLVGIGALVVPTRHVLTRRGWHDIPGVEASGLFRAGGLVQIQRPLAGIRAQEVPTGRADILQQYAFDALEAEFGTVPMPP